MTAFKAPTVIVLCNKCYTELRIDKILQPNETDSQQIKEKGKQLDQDVLEVKATTPTIKVKAK